MSRLKKNLTVSVEDYLAGEAQSDIKHEYVNGYVYAMVGASREHSRINVNLAGLVNAHLRKTPCRVLGNDFKVRIGNIFYYPDLSVICDKSNTHRYYTEEPVIVVEILSKSTEKEDRFHKWLNYQTIPSLKEYVLVAQDKMEVSVYRRAGQEWTLEIYSPGDTVDLTAIDLALPIERIYEEVWD
jgi:Uma2 family endonuclease